jgi:uridine kinase
LLIIAGCNGSGKSTFPKPLAPDNFSFWLWLSILRFYNSLIDGPEGNVEHVDIG